MLRFAGDVASSARGSIRSQPGKNLRRRRGQSVVRGSLCDVGGRGRRLEYGR